MSNELKLVLDAIKKKVKGYSKMDRLNRLVVLGTKQALGHSSFEEDMEIESIQLIRKANGEIDQVRRDQLAAIKAEEELRRD
jgi:hypothetical protein